MMEKKHKILIPILLALAFAFLASAQGVDLITSGIILSISPDKPKPGEEVRIKARSLAFDTSRAVFSWRVEGELVKSGRGLTSIIAKAGPVGSILNIRVSATSPNGEVFTQTADLDVTDIDLVINPLTYTPYFYRGSALPTPGSLVEIIAVPFLYFQGSRLDPATLFYEWSLGGQKMNSQSGEGKSKFVLKLQDASSSYEIKVNISSRSGIVKSEKRLRFNTHQPETLFYLTDTLTGPRSYPSNSFKINSDSSLVIVAEPYYFDLSSLVKATIGWLAGNETIDTNNPFLLDLDISSKAAGIYNFSFKAEKSRSIYQRTSGNLSVEVISALDLFPSLETETR